MKEEIPHHMQDNTNGYSKDWQPYTGDYDKFEYDITTVTGNVILNCYPNARYFSSFSSNDRVHESEVSQIRFAKNPIADINYDEFYQ